MALYSLSTSIILVLLLFVCRSRSALTCLDEKNNTVDWFIALKYPKSYDFVYLTPNNVQWTASKSDISSSNNMVALTLSQSYAAQNFYAYYNDEPGRMGYWGSERGHLKGVVNFDKSGGYWLVHSVPKFPSESSYLYNEGERRYGQSFICVTVGFSRLPPIVRQLLMMQSTVYSHNLPNNFTQSSTLMDDLNKLVMNKKSTTMNTNAYSFTSANDQSFIHFGKSRNFDDDLYAAFIAPSLQTSMFVETWIRGDRIDSSCNLQYKVYNVIKVQLLKDKFNESSDHSKWAVSKDAAKPFVCIGDINRMTSQFERGGGSMCVSNVQVWNIFNALVANYEPC